MLASTSGRYPEAKPAPRGSSGAPGTTSTTVTGSAAAELLGGLAEQGGHGRAGAGRGVQGDPVGADHEGGVGLPVAQRLVGGGRVGDGGDLERAGPGRRELLAERPRWPGAGPATTTGRSRGSSSLAGQANQLTSRPSSTVTPMAMPTARAAGDGVCFTTPPDRDHKRMFVLLRLHDAIAGCQANVRFTMAMVPRVSAEHLTARRQQILDAARVCFLRNGFHQTSMQDVIREANLSVGAVYRYFPSKTDLITAIAEQVIEQIAAVFDELGRRSRHRRWSRRWSARSTWSPPTPGRTGCCGWPCRSGARRPYDPALAVLCGQGVRADPRRSWSRCPPGHRHGDLPAGTDPYADRGGAVRPDAGVRAAAHPHRRTGA